MKATHTNIERQMPVSEAYRKIHDIIREHHLQVRTISVGEDIKTYQTFLTDEQRGKQFIGCGKGLGLQSEVSALFEAFEHYIAHISFLNEEKVIPLPISQNKDIEYLISTDILPKNFVSLMGGKNILMPWIRLDSFSSKEPLLYPLFLAEPNYNQKNKFPYDVSNFSELSYLSTSSGVASGTSFDEAVVHALNEAIERDATALFLYSGFIKKEKIKIIDPTTIPDYLKKQIDIIEKEFNDKLFIIDITSHIGVPSFCVTFSKYDAPIKPKGFGTSLSKSYALERALLEALQPVHLRNENLNRVERNTVKRLEKYPLLQSAAIADVNDIILKNNFLELNFEDLPDLYRGENLSEQREKILSLIQQQGFDTYYHKIYEAQDYSCVKVLVPGFSNLYQLQIGKLVLPNVEALSNRLK